MAKRIVPRLPKSLRDAMSNEYLANEAEYWKIRNRLMAQYQGKWVAFHKGRVISCSDDFVSVMDEAGRNGCPMAYIDQVGQEGMMEFRSRRVTFRYDQSYVPTALPRAEVTFRNFFQIHQQTFNDVIPDTGSDLSVLSANDSNALNLLSGPRFAATLGGIGGQSALCVVCRAYAEVGGRQFSALVQVVVGQSERLLGREVLNQVIVTFDGPKGHVTFDV